MGGVRLGVRLKLLVSQQPRGKGGAVSKLMESMAADEDFEPSQDSSFSEDENLPQGAPLARPNTPGEPCHHQAPTLNQPPSTRCDGIVPASSIGHSGWPASHNCLQYSLHNLADHHMIRYL